MILVFAPIELLESKRYQSVPDIQMHTTPVRVLSGDIGGTKTRLAIITVTGTQLRTEREQSYPSRDYAEFDEVLGDFLHGSDIPGRAAFGIAGPVQGRVAQTTNLPWNIDADAMQHKYGFEQCVLLNDLEATASGLPALGAEDLLTLHPVRRMPAVMRR